MPPSTRTSGPRARWFYVVVAACLAGLLLWGVFLYDVHPGGPPTFPAAGGDVPTQVEVQGVDMIIDYWTQNLSDTSYMKSPECGPCPVNLTPSERWTTSVTLSNLDAGRSHAVSNLTVASPFVLLSVGPALPYELGPGENVTLELVVQVPATPGSVFLTGSIGTT